MVKRNTKKRKPPRRRARRRMRSRKHRSAGTTMTDAAPFPRGTIVDVRVGNTWIPATMVGRNVAGSLPGLNMYDVFVWPRAAGHTRMNFPTGPYATMANDIRLSAAKRQDHSPTEDDKPRAKKRKVVRQAVPECTYGRSMRNEEQWLDETASVEDLKRMLEEQGIPLPEQWRWKYDLIKALQEKRGSLRMPKRNTLRDRGISQWDLENQTTKAATRKRQDMWKWLSETGHKHKPLTQREFLERHPMPGVDKRWDKFVNR